MGRKLQKAARRVWKAYREYGPVDDGRPEGDEFEAALDALMAAEIDERYAEDCGNAPEQRKVAKLRELLGDVCDLLEKIRYQNWPVAGLGIGMTPHEIDAVLTPVQKVAKFRKPKNRKAKKKSSRRTAK
jgi:hypothetical protein